MRTRSNSSQPKIRNSNPLPNPTREIGRNAPRSVHIKASPSFKHKLTKMEADQHQEMAPLDENEGVWNPQLLQLLYDPGSVDHILQQHTAPQTLALEILNNPELLARISELVAAAQAQPPATTQALVPVAAPAQVPQLRDSLSNVFSMLLCFPTAIGVPQHKCQCGKSCKTSQALANHRKACSSCSGAAQGTCRQASPVQKHFSHFTLR